jgi:hypothetical protein
MFDIFVMDMGGNDSNVRALCERFPHARVVRYYDTHLDTLRRCANRARTRFFWAVSSCCDYQDFDFDYQAVPWESTQLHCWHSDDQKFGDTFLVNTDEFKKQSQIELLEWYRDVNWHRPGVPRLDFPTVVYRSDDLVETIKNTEISSPYVLLTRQDQTGPVSAPCLWRNRDVHSYNRSNSTVLIPREIKRFLSSQVYDYPYISRHKDDFFEEKSLDVAYVSNGESESQRWYDNLRSVLANRPNRLFRVDGVQGRTQALRTAAERSQTPWVFVVTGKVEILPSFDFEWQPDYLQQPKHYIFHSRNPINGLEYGHMGMVAYNRTLAMGTTDPGLDFTLSRPHQVVPVLAGIAHFNADPEMTWRTAFREVIKLQHSVQQNQDVESQYRLNQWLTHAEGRNAEWSLRGAADAVRYYINVLGDLDLLMLSYHWDWLHQQFQELYSH